MSQQGPSPHLPEGSREPAGALGSRTPWPLRPWLPEALMRAGSPAVPLPVDRGLEKPQPSRPAKAVSPLRWYELVTEGPQLLASEKRGLSCGSALLHSSGHNWRGPARCALVAPGCGLGLPPAALGGSPRLRHLGRVLSGTRRPRALSSHVLLPPG